MFQAIKDYSHRHPLRLVLMLALVTRLCAAIFSGGYAMHDDHFLIIETSGSWVDGEDYNDWLPSSQRKQIAEGTRTQLEPQGHSLIYPGIHYGIFYGLKSLGIDNPKVQMLFVRLLHAFFSVWAVFLAFKITTYLSNRKNAFYVGVVLALSWSLPFLSVRNLVEMACIPFLLWGVYLLAKYAGKATFKIGFIAGVAFGLAFVIRYQLAVFLFGLGMVFLFQKKWREAAGILLGFSLCVVLLQGCVDYWIWGQPFAEFIGYVKYNMSAAKADYAADLGKTYWFGYIFVLGLMSIPVLGLFWIAGFFVQLKKYAWITLPVIAFVAFHSVYINRQERFVFPVIYLIVIVGVIGWNTFQEKSRFWEKNSRLWKGILIFSGALNVVFLVVLTTDYSKRSRVESAYFLYDKPRVSLIVQENTYRGDTPMVPRFYSGKWKYGIVSIKTPAERDAFFQLNTKPDYIYFYGDEELNKRLLPFQEQYPKLHLVANIAPSFLDVILVTINPLNKNERILIYATS